MTATKAESVDRLNVYLDKSSTAGTVELGIYASASTTEAGSLLGRCVVAGPVAGAWNRCTLPSKVAVKASTSYWFAVLHPTGSAGTIRFRSSSTSGRTYTSKSSTLTRTPSPWANGTNWGAQTASIYADLAPTAPEVTPVPTPVPTTTATPVPTSTPVQTPVATPNPTGTTPTNVRATVESGRVVLRWDASTDPNFSYFAVRRSTDASADQTTWTRLAGNHTSPTVTDSGLSAGTYHYYVTAVDTSGAVSERSNVASATIAGAPTATPTATPTSTPTATPTATPTVAPGSCPVAQANVPDGRDPWGGCFPGPKTTGVPDGTNLTTYTGPCTITTANTVIEAKTVNCDLNVRAPNLVIRNSKINGMVWVDNPSLNASFTISDSTIDAGEVSATYNDGKRALGKSHFTAIRVETVRGIGGAWCEYDCTIRDSWIHGQDPDEGGAAHQSGIRLGSGTAGAGQLLEHNTIHCDAPNIAPDAGCSANITGYGDFATIQNNTVSKNLLPSTPGGTCAYGGSSKSKPYPNGNNNIFKDNVFQRGLGNRGAGAMGMCGYWFAMVDLDAGVRGNQWSNNVWDTGGLVNAS